jgi:2',3'-cyclic-nucleotide 2'-phosphodiesterase (5'-nucleotidase family)
MNTIQTCHPFFRVRIISILSFPLIHLFPASLNIFFFFCISALLFMTPYPAHTADLDSRWPSCEAGASLQKISFVHISDTHANYNPDHGGSSPMARIRGFVDQVKKENPYTIFTNAGDDYEKGSIAEELSRGRTTRQVTQAMRYDLRTIGNHDFAWGLDELLQFSQDQHSVVLSTNTKMIPAKEMNEKQQPGWVDYAELTVGCVKIGFFGLVSKPWMETGEQYDGPYYREHPELQTDFDFAPIIKDVIAQHRKKVDLLVLISHLGIHDDIRLAGEQQGLDIILGGHTHTTMTEPLRIGNTVIIHPGSHAENMARLDLDYDLETKQIKSSQFKLVPNREGEVVANKITDEEIKKIISPYQEVIRNNFVRVNASQNPREMAHIAARAAIATLQCDAAFVETRAAIKENKAGWLTRQDILDTFPVEREPAATPGFSSLYQLTVTGADLIYARSVLPDFLYEGPDKIHPASTYTIALPKGLALNNQRYLGRKINLEPPFPSGELWEMVVRFGHDQNNVHLALDEKTPAEQHKLVAALDTIH